MRTVSAVYFHKGLLSKLALLVKSSQINWNCDKNCGWQELWYVLKSSVHCAEYFQLQKDIWELAKEFRLYSFQFPQADSQADGASFGTQKLLRVPMVFPVCSAGVCCPAGAEPWLCPWRRAGPGTAVLCPAEQVTVGRWTPGLSADHEDVMAPPALQTTQPKRPKVVTFWRPPGSQTVLLRCLPPERWGQRVEPDNHADCRGIVGFLSPLIFLVCLPGSLKSWEQQGHRKWLFY